LRLVESTLLDGRVVALDYEVVDRQGDRQKRKPCGMRTAPVTGFSSLSPFQIMAVLSSFVDVRTA
jgi:hypothetical protein